MHKNPFSVPSQPWTLTDFKIIGLELRDLAWSWGIIPHTAPEKPVDEASASSEASAERKPDVSGSSEAASQSAEPSANPATTSDKHVPVKAEPTMTAMPPPPSRIRIYFHTGMDHDTVSAPQGTDHEVVGRHLNSLLCMRIAVMVLVSKVGNNNNSRNLRNPFNPLLL